MERINCASVRGIFPKYLDNIIIFGKKWDNDVKVLLISPPHTPPPPLPPSPSVVSRISLVPLPSLPSVMTHHGSPSMFWSFSSFAHHDPYIFLYKRVYISSILVVLELRNTSRQHHVPNRTRTPARPHARPPARQHTNTTTRAHATFDGGREREKVSTRLTQLQGVDCYTIYSQKDHPVLMTLLEAPHKRNTKQRGGFGVRTGSPGCGCGI